LRGREPQFDQVSGEGLGEALAELTKGFGWELFGEEFNEESRGHEELVRR
jgi:hypothetical protein